MTSEIVCFNSCWNSAFQTPRCPLKNLTFYICHMQFCLFHDHTHVVVQRLILIMHMKSP